MGNSSDGILGGVLDPIFGDPQEAAAKQQRKDTKAAVRAALEQLSPEAIAQLTQVFLPQIMSRISPQLQSQVQGLSANLGQRGLQESGVGANAEAGLRAAAINNASQQAFQNAFGLAGQRAGVHFGGLQGLTNANQLLASSRSGLDQVGQAVGIASGAGFLGGIGGGGNNSSGGFQPPPGVPIGNQAGSGTIFI